MMPTVKIRPEEMEIVKAAAIRIERRSNSRFVIDQSRIEVTEAEEGTQLPQEVEEDEDRPAIVG